MRLEHVSPNDARWLAVLDRYPTTLFQSPSWSRVIEATYGFASRVALAVVGNDVLGGLPYALVEDFHGKRRIASPLPTHASRSAIVSGKLSSKV